MSTENFRYSSKDHAESDLLIFSAMNMHEDVPLMLVAEGSKFYIATKPPADTSKVLAFALNSAVFNREL